MTPLNIWLYEDNPNAAELWELKIKSAYSDAEITRITGSENFEALLTLIHDRREYWRSDDHGCKLDEQRVDQVDVDQVDVIIVDYDLLEYSTNADSTGKRLAYLLRCFTQCGFIIVLNEYGNNVFDLHLGGGVSDFADTHIGDMQIGNPGLWRTPFEGYRPWYWPVVPNARENFEKCVEDVKGNLDQSILKFLKLDCVVDWLPRQVWDFLAMDKELESVTFQDLVTSTNAGMDPRDKLDIGAQPKFIFEQQVRIAAARIYSLLNLNILPEQSVLIDAPHLASRFPSVVRGQRDDIDAWNKLCNPVCTNVDDLLIDTLSKHRFSQAHWLWRPAWYWPMVDRDENIDEVRDPWTYQEPGWMFCEDISRFVPAVLAQEFQALVSPPFVKRFIFNHNWLQESPNAKLAKEHVKQIGDGSSQDPSQVEYVPQSALSY